MTTNRLTSLVCAFAAVTTLLPPAVGAPQRYREQFQNNYASADFVHSDPSGCIKTDVSVDVADGKVKNQPGGFTLTPWAFVRLSRYNSCTGERVYGLRGSAEVDPSDVKIDRALNSGSLKTKITVWDGYSNSPLDLDISVTWKATGALERSQGLSYWSSGDQSERMNRHGFQRAADAWGDVKLASEVLVPPGRTSLDEYAFIGNSSGWYLEVYH